jgi:hypothetical protein
LLILSKDPHSALYSIESISGPPRVKGLKKFTGTKRTQPPSSLESLVDVKREIVPPTRTLSEQQSVQDEMELVDESNTKADENEVLQDYPKNAFIIPSCSAWFSVDTIHEIEMQTLPEFFCGKFPHKNPATYMDYRNYIIKLYRESPNSYLSATVCRKNLPGDVCSIIRLHAFLEHWGLINFNVDPLLKPAKVQLSNALDPTLVDIAAKGFIKASEAEAL